MKKIYFFVVCFIALSVTVNAQSTCTMPNGFGFPFKYSGGCYVFVTGTMANADINVYSGTTKINATIGAKTGNDGTGVAFFTCGQTITKIIITLPGGAACEISGDHLAALANLPVKLSRLQATLKGETTVGLKWTSVFELDSYKYLVERSTDGRSYTTIGQVDASGSSMLSHDYGYDDAQVGNGVAYYRLKMVDIDGKYDYSTVVYVNNKKGVSSEVLSVFPNPFKAEIQLRGVSSGDINSKNIKVFNVTGKEVKYSVSGANAIRIDPNAPTGVYILKVQTQNQKVAQVYKIMKQ
jgi:Secretion system C-terminal sorting domain